MELEITRQDEIMFAAADAILENFDKVNSSPALNSLLGEEAIDTINSIYYEEGLTQTQVYEKFLLEYINWALEDENYEALYKRAKVIYEITK
jgi:hypothetical protein